MIDAVPFPLTFAETVPDRWLSTAAEYDISANVTRLLGRAGPTGQKDIVMIITDAADVTADIVSRELLRRGTQVRRFHTQDLLDAVSLTMRFGMPSQGSGELAAPDYDLMLDEVRSVWFRRPVLPLTEPLDRSRLNPDQGAGATESFIALEAEAALAGMFATLGAALWVSHPSALREAENKVGNLILAASIGFRIPQTLVTSDPEQLLDFFDLCGGEVIVKTLTPWSGLRDGTVQGVWTNRVLPAHLKLARLSRASACLFQEYVPKDVEVRAIVVGHTVLAAEIHSQRSAISRDDWRHYDLDNTPYYVHQLPEVIESRCLHLVDKLGLSFGAIDLIRRPDGEYVFLEINPNGQWYWVEMMTGLPIVTTVADLLDGTSE